jgi:hypothetical protein
LRVSRRSSESGPRVARRAVIMLATYAGDNVLSAKATCDRLRRGRGAIVVATFTFAITWAGSIAERTLTLFEQDPVGLCCVPRSSSTRSTISWSARRPARPLGHDQRLSAAAPSGPLWAFSGRLGDR